MCGLFAGHHTAEGLAGVFIGTAFNTTAFAVSIKSVLVRASVFGAVQQFVKDTANFGGGLIVVTNY